MNSGSLYALAAFAIWGLFPFYFKLLKVIPPLEMLAHRMVWSLVFVASALAVRGEWRWCLTAVREPRNIIRFAICAGLLSANWGLYIWAVNTGRVVEASLGYFINPLVSVLFGLAFLRERLRLLQWGTVAIAVAGVLWLTWKSGSPPWISLVLAVTFGAYGLLRKTARLGPLEGLAFEAILLFPVAFLYLLWLVAHGESHFGDVHAGIQLLIAAAGPVTAIPLLLFAASARRIPLSTLGLFQYVTPTLQLLLGVFVYDEPFGHVQLVGYGAIWIALMIYSFENLWETRRDRENINQADS
ncbi:EamA family transporter RarD [Pararhizobium sp. LjRoot235]|uniref:EamA family transporter RarD n=1 Tax=Pararhizobium sp. LjRoot235 TaxID=3342291 RepID=UPI003ECC1ACD